MNSRLLSHTGHPMAGCPLVGQSPPVSLSLAMTRGRLLFGCPRRSCSAWCAGRERGLGCGLVVNGCALLDGTFRWPVGAVNRGRDPLRNGAGTCGCAVSAAAIEGEWRRPGARDSSTGRFGPEWAAIEFKYDASLERQTPRWTQHLGEALKDFYRLATMPADFLAAVRPTMVDECVGISTGSLARCGAGSTPESRRCWTLRTSATCPPRPPDALIDGCRNLPRVVGVCVAAEAVST